MITFQCENICEARRDNRGRARATKTWWNKEIKWYQAILLHSRIPGTQLFLLGFYGHYEPFYFDDIKICLRAAKNKSFSPQKLRRIWMVFFESDLLASLKWLNSKILKYIMTTSRFLELLPENGNNMQGPRVYGTKSGVSPHRRVVRLEVRQFGFIVMVLDV